MRAARRAARACRPPRSASAGLPSTWPSIRTIVSTPNTVSPGSQLDRAGLAEAVLLGELARRQRRAAAPRSPARRSRKSSPSCVRIARRCGERDARTKVTARREADRPRRSTAGARAPRSPASPTRARCSRRAPARSRRGSCPAPSRSGFVAPIIVRTVDDRARALERERDERARRDEVDELAEERPLGVLGVVLLGDGAGEHELLEPADAEPAALEAADQFGDESAADGVGLEQDKGRLGWHARFRLVWRVRTGFRTASSCAAAAACGVGASQNGQSRHSGLSGERQRWTGELEPPCAVRAGDELGLDVAAAAGHMPSSPSRRSIARISSSRSRTSSRYSGGRRIV